MVSCCRFSVFLVSPIVLYGYYKRKILGYLVSIVLIFASINYIGIVSYFYNFNPTFLGLCQNLEANSIYFRPWARISAYLIGMILGLIYLSTIEKSEKISIAYSYKDNFGDKFEKWCLKITNIKLIRYFCYCIGIILIPGSALIPYILYVNGLDY